MGPAFVGGAAGHSQRQLGGRIGIDPGMTKRMKFKAPFRAAMSALIIILLFRGRARNRIAGTSCLTTTRAAPVEKFGDGLNVRANTVHWDSVATWISAVMGVAAVFVGVFAFAIPWQKSVEDAHRAQAARFMLYVFNKNGSQSMSMVPVNMSDAPVFNVSWQLASVPRPIRLATSGHVMVLPASLEADSRFADVRSWEGMPIPLQINTREWLIQMEFQDASGAWWHRSYILPRRVNVNPDLDRMGSDAGRGFRDEVALTGGKAPPEFWVQSGKG